MIIRIWSKDHAVARLLQDGSTLYSDISVLFSSNSNLRISESLEPKWDRHYHDSDGNEKASNWDLFFTSNYATKSISEMDKIALWPSRARTVWLEPYNFPPPFETPRSPPKGCSRTLGSRAPSHQHPFEHSLVHLEASLWAKCRRTRNGRGWQRTIRLI